MNFNTFSVSTTNVFPMSNTTTGGQLLTEFNIRCRESVGVGPMASNDAVQYMIGHSFVNAEDDFKIRIQSDGSGTPISSTTLEILPGAALLNGHYVQNLSNMLVDIAQANIQRQTDGLTPLKGHLVVGLKATYSTIDTIAGALLPEDDTGVFAGISVVILPESEFKLPTDVPTDESLVTAHIKLGEFNYINGAINTVVNNYPQKCQVYEASRISNVEGLLSNIYIRKTGLNPKKLYTFAGKGTDPETGLDTWCDATPSLMNWDSNPTLTTQNPGTAEAAFGADIDGRIKLVLPHKQVDGMTDTNGDPQYYANKTLNVPLADFATNTPGTVNSAYTKKIKDITQRINELYRLPTSKQRGYLDLLTDITDLPHIGSTWSVGDYVLVRRDMLLDDSVDTTSPPASMYVVLPGYVQTITYVSTTQDTEDVPVALTGILVDSKVQDEAPDTTHPNVYNLLWDFTLNVYRGVVDEDYFVVVYDDGTNVNRYYYKVATTGVYEYSEAVMLTGEIPLATQTTIGGFFNVEDTDLDYGYVYRDDNGNLRLLDYELLRSGTLAYQLGENYTTPSGLTTEAVQEYLDEYVNQRVAFPNYNQVHTAQNPNVIDIYITLTAESTASQLNIYDIDSRFNTAVCIHILGNADTNTVINISDCQKVIIDSNIGGTPVINLMRSNLYYDSGMLGRLHTIVDLSLWYEKYYHTDPDLLIDGMTVREVNAPIIADDLDFWNVSTPNDNHFMYALQSITYGTDGSIVGCGMFIKNDTTNNVASGKYVITSTFAIPQGAGLTYPVNKLNHQIKITGSFVAAYATDTPVGYMVMSTQFTALSQTYNAFDTTDMAQGSIAFYVDANEVTNITGMESGTSIDGWEPGSFHIFEGGALS